VQVQRIEVNTLTLGFKAYELSNHLGNVLTTISDNYFAPQPSTGGVSARVLSSQDYFPFGMVMTERSFQEKQQRKYRFGFNGKEEDFDMGEGVLNFEARGMDSRTCRFTSVDPLAGKYPYNSPYVFCHNNPITYIDLNGLEPIKPKIKQNVIIIIFDADELKNYKNTPSDYNSFHVIMTTNIENASKQFLEYVGDNTVKNVCIVAHGSSGGGTSNLNQNQDYHVTSKKIRAYMSNPTNDPSISTPIVDDEAHILKDVQHLEEITTKIEDGGSLLMASCYGGLGEKGSEYGRDLAQLNCNRITIYLNQDKCNLSYQMPSKRDEKGNLVIDKEGKIDKYAHQIATLDVSISGKGYFKDGVVRVDTNGTQTKLKDLPNRTGRLIINTKDKTKPAFYEEEPSKKK
jgi:RHS repeat-associated protein